MGRRCTKCGSPCLTHHVVAGIGVSGDYYGYYEYKEWYQCRNCGHIEPVKPDAPPAKRSLTNGT